MIVFFVKCATRLHEKMRGGPTRMRVPMRGTEAEHSILFASKTIAVATAGKHGTPRYYERLPIQPRR
jgi:hypothetical protein